MHDTIVTLKKGEGRTLKSVVCGFMIMKLIPFLVLSKMVILLLFMILTVILWAMVLLTPIPKSLFVCSHAVKENTITEEFFLRQRVRCLNIVNRQLIRPVAVDFRRSRLASGTSR